MVKGGAIGNGNFALHAKSVFQSNTPRFTFAGERIREDGRNTLRWDFVVPQTTQRIHVEQGEQHAIVGYHGSFWVDPTSLDLVRLEVYADDIPPNLKIASTADSVEYHRVQLGEEAFLLPSKSELTMKDLGGAESQNRTTFSGCRQYTGESTISFDDPADAKSVAQDDRTLTYPAGASIWNWRSKHLLHEGADCRRRSRYGYSKETSEVGFWPGGAERRAGARPHHALAAAADQPARMGDWLDIFRNGVAEYTRAASRKLGRPADVSRCWPPLTRYRRCFARSRIRRVLFLYPVVALPFPADF